ncbi:cbb3-type cytochrome oxidase assembly protein CcoS [Helicobacter sp. MIT 14-3879]|uniref:cbb3-type cytochrome oxidase assembly protein CcoS n=1 Tax=Helicobacter sp. MIT 14-3879 TaxID=2040649 RepID=UPI000E1E983A|nr:cbb3-type cytochrome oxidase assembly protein CcoS [Helicobacter sp. MIT 14-3879]RDU59773.1 cbb3-type cytochrome oxidase assembly protein CcoS [Helicobacter sp. MIT 14-3879]
MSSWVMALMLGVSLCIGFLGLVAFLWGLKNGQFDDKEKMMRGVLFDGIEDLNSADVSNKNTQAKRQGV